MTKRKESKPRALPGAVFVPEETLKMIIKQVAMLPDKDRAKREAILLRSGYYRASTDQVVLYQHQSRMSPPKADLVRVVNCLVREVTVHRRNLMGAPVEDGKFIDFVKESWDKLLELDSPVTLIICINLRGESVDYYIDMFQFHGTLPKHSQE